VPAFRTPEACADALRAFFAWHQPAQTAPHADGSSLHDAAHAVSSIAGGSASELDALRVFAALGIECARTVRARAPDFAHGLPYPVAVKICSADIAHKTDIGGVALDVGDAHECRNTATLIIERARTAMPAARVDGVVVQPMTRGLGEAIVGYRQDPQVGPVVLVGAGGSLAEALRDYAVALAPVALDEALEMIARVKGFALLRGYRNTPRGDLNALAQAVVAMSRLALLEGQPVAEAEINPLVVRGDGQGVVAVDGLLVMKGARA
jgi:acyl-CoA synthetase (NDP forming)